MTKDEALKQALYALEIEDAACRYMKDETPSQIVEAITAIKQALAAPVQEPVAFLANGTRFKISYDSRQSGGQIHGIPPELGGRWVAFVAAEDDCHLKLTTPPAAQRQWVGLEREIAAAVLDHCYGHGGVSDDMIERTTEVIKTKLKELNT